MAIRCFLALCVLAVPVFSYSAGAPAGSCGDMIPQHHTDPQSSAAPYTIALSKNRIRAGETIEVTISGKGATDLIKGLLVQARVGSTPIGTFDVSSSSNILQLLDCGNSKGSAVTHKKLTEGVKSVKFNWTAPSGLKEKVHFRYTVVLNGGVFWVGEKSELLNVQ
ncbi:unnamed protein product [Diamesa serratosioi]